MKRRFNNVLLQFLIYRLSTWTVIVGLLFVMLIDNSSAVTNIAKSSSAYTMLAPPPLAKDYISAVNAHLLNDLKLQIKKVLNMHPDNRTLDKYVTQVFNVKSVNPTYVFVLPDPKNRTLVLRRSDFNEAVFPNVTNLNKFKKSPLNPKGAAPLRAVTQEEQVDADDEDYADESQMGRIIEENIRTERNFIAFVDNLNDDLEEEYESSQLDDRFRYNVGQESKISSTKVKAIVDLKRKRIQTSKKLDWKDFGLEGWFGGLSPVVNEFDMTLESPQAAGNKSKPLMSAIKSKFKPHLPIPMYPASGEIPDPGDSLVKLIGEEKKELSQTGKVPSPKPIWPITSSRDQHRDEDVFIARANNPFGHSTKWKYRNSSTNGMPQTRESRSKRGVVQLYSMIKCATGCDPLIYKGYGCYCGFLGSGRALDSIDRCCKMHDYCYSRSNCPMFLEYFVPYLWKCYRGKPLCAVDHGEWGGPGSCAARLCECDRLLSKCLRHHYCPGRRTVCTSSPFRLLQNLVMVF